MKNLFYSKRKFFIILMGFLVLGFCFGCQEDPLQMETVDLKTEKNGVILDVPLKGFLPSGAEYEIILPNIWNALPKKVLLVYAHGYRDADKSVILPNDMIGSIPIKDFITSQNMGYASTSYRDNGLVVLEGVEDIVLLRSTIQNFFDPSNPLNPGFLPPQAVLLIGPSEGGLITVLTIEQNPGIFNAAIATCCPIGDFYGQLQYYGDAHVLFKYFFGVSINEINLGSPKRISKNTIAAWEDGSLQSSIIEVLHDDYLNNGGNKILQFLACAKIPADLSNPDLVGQTILEVLRFPIKATNDAIFRLEGNPFNNKYPKRIYTGSDNDRKLNLTVERIKTSDWGQAKKNVAEYYETSGNLKIPLVTMHTQFDHISFYSHQTDYILKVNAISPAPYLLTHIPIPGRYGHCNFTPQEIMAALGTLIN